MIILNNTKQIYLIFLISVLLAACGHSKKIDVSNIAVDAKIERFDKEFDAMATKPMAQQAACLQKKYGVFYHDFIALILEDRDVNIQDTSYFKLLRQVFANQAYKDLKHDVDSIYPGELTQQNIELTDAFRHIKYYYPQAKLPKVYAYYSGFEAKISFGDDYFAVGLDLFLGADSRFYPALTKAYPRYLSRNFNPQNIVPRVVEDMARENMFPESDSSKSLLSKMIYNGKIMYYMDQVLPDVPDTVKIGYTGDQLKWCQSFESKIWAYFLDENLLYETDYPKIQKYLTEAPFTPGLGEKNESAPKLAIWTGWQIVKQYMDKHPDVTLPALMADMDAQQILNDSKYRPK
jgi:gliding motility-associated lipoprotein GldB